MPNGTFILTACSLDVTSAGTCGHFGVTLAGCTLLDFCNLKHSVAAAMAGLQAQVYNCVSFYRHFIISVRRFTDYTKRERATV